MTYKLIRFRAFICSKYKKVPQVIIKCPQNQFCFQIRIRIEFKNSRNLYYGTECTAVYMSLPVAEIRAPNRSVSKKVKEVDK